MYFFPNKNDSELFGRTIRVNLAKPMKIKEGSAKAGKRELIISKTWYLILDEDISQKLQLVLSWRGSAVPVRTSVCGLRVYLQVQGATVQVHFLLVVAKESAEWEAAPFGWY